MKTCGNCGGRIRRTEPAETEFGLPSFDGRRYPDSCPKCGASVE